MRKLKVLWRATRAQRVLEELETWSTLLLAIGAALLLYATLKAQAAYGAGTGLEHRVASPYTSLVAVDETPAHEALERQGLQTTLPAGAQWQTAFPRTATPAPLLRWLGAGILLAGPVLLAAPRTRWRTTS